MDNKEAIYYLQYLRHDVHANSPYDVAIVTAINALSETAPPKSNADRIRQMTDEELAEFFCQISQCCGNDASCLMCPIFDGCTQNVRCMERWLKQEVIEDAGTD